MDVERRRRLATLITELDHESTMVAEEAEYSLIQDFGEEALEPLLAAAPSFGEFGRLCATQVFTAIGDWRAAKVIVPWLRSDDCVVRAWSAEALGNLGATEAVEPLRTAWAAAKRAGPPDHDDATALRAALHQLGARSIVLPADVAALRSPEDEAQGSLRGWPADALPGVLEGLAAADQVVLWFDFWCHRESSFSWISTTSIKLDWSKPWKTLVADSLDDGLTSPHSKLPPDAIVEVEWVDHSDADADAASTDRSAR